MFRQKRDVPFTSIVHQNLLALGGDQSASAPLFSRIGPPTNACLITAGDFRDGPESAADLYNGLCRFHAA